MVSRTHLVYPLLLLTLLLGILLQSCQGERVYRVTTILEKPYLMIKNSTNARGNDMYEGFIPDLMREIADLVGFDYELRLVRDNKYGRREPNGKWNGMVGELVRGEVDIAAAPLTRTAAREMAIDFAYPFLPATLTALMREDIDVDSIEELANNTDIIYGTIQGGSTQNAFRGATKAPYQRMWARMASMEDSPFAYNLKEGVERIRKEAYALIVETPMGDYLAHHEPCDLKTVGRFTTDSFARSWAFGLPKRSPLLNDINSAMLNLQEEMAIAKLYRKWWNDECDDSGAGIVTMSGLVLMTSVFFHFFF